MKVICPDTKCPGYIQPGPDMGHCPHSVEHEHGDGCPAEMDCPNCVPNQGGSDDG